MEELKARLSKSEALISLVAEQDVSKRLAQQGWYSVHSCFYRDVQTEKIRELDTKAVMSWKKKNKTGEIHSVINLLVECKTMKGYHLLVSQSPDAREAVTRLCLWDGYFTEFADGSLEDAAVALRKGGMSSDDSTKVLQRMQDVAYPGDSARPFSVMLDPPAIDPIVTAFRETNIGVEKELDNSVLWRASQTLASAYLSYKKNAKEGWLSELAIVADFFVSYRKSKTVVADMLGHIKDETSRVELYHPVVVVDANIWLVQGTKLESIPWCRFTQRESQYHANWWFDIVTTGGFNAYCKLVTEYYVRKYKKARARRDS